MGPFLLVVAAALAVAAVVPTLIGVLAAKVLGVGVPQVQLGVGRPRIEFTLGATRVRLTPWLLSGWCRTKDSATADVFEDSPGRSFDTVHPLARVGVVLVAPLGLLGLLALAYGEDILRHFGTGFAQVVSGALSPMSVAQSLLARTAELAAADPLRAVAVVATKLVCVALLPIPPLAGGNAILEAWRWRSKSYPDMPSVRGVAFLAVLLLLLWWLVAFVRFVAA